MCVRRGDSWIAPTKYKHPYENKPKASAFFNEICPSGKWNSYAVKMFAARTWANFISHRTKWDISQCAIAHYFTFGNAEYFTKFKSCNFVLRAQKTTIFDRRLSFLLFHFSLKSLVVFWQVISNSEWWKGADVAFLPLVEKHYILLEFESLLQTSKNNFFVAFIQQKTHLRRMKVLRWQSKINIYSWQKCTYLL